MRAQAPATLSNDVITFGFATIAHTNSSYHRWLKADGTYVDITTDLVADNEDLGPIAPESGGWSYVQQTSTAGQITFVPNNAGSGSYLLSLTFQTTTTGIATEGVTVSNGNFAIRSSQFGIGPVNLSTRTFLAATGPTIAGFVINGTSNRFVLIRAVGPGLAAFGVPNTASTMGLSLYSSTTLLGSGVNWSATAATTALYANAFSIAGGFALTPGQTDSCLLLELAPGAYTSQMTAAAGGNAMIEVYFLP